MSRAPSIDFTRMNARLEALAAINRGADGSCCRLALTDADRAGRDLVQAWMRELGLQLHIDRIGNMIGVRAGRTSGPPVMTGSHIDTVATGGRYDGAYGVLAGLEVMQTLNEAQLLTEHPLAVAVFTNEEGVRFQPDMMGSLVYAGGLAVEQALAAAAEGGVTLGAELARIGYAGSMPCGEIKPRAFVELHIEQGPVLHLQGEVLAAVENLQGISWQRITIDGVSNHAGTTPMSMRHDTALCAAEIAVFVRKLVRRMGGSQVGTVGFIQPVPNLINVIARRTTLTVDLRNTDDLQLAAAQRELAQFMDELSRAERVKIQVEQIASSPAVQFHDRVLRVIEDAARELGFDSIRRMTSGAGHDAQMMARICPAAMIFVPSIGGISHNPKEITEPAHLETGANTLLRTLLRLGNEA